MGAAGTGEGCHRMVEDPDKEQPTSTPKPAEVALPYGKLVRNLGFLAMLETHLSRCRLPKMQC